MPRGLVGEFINTFRANGLSDALYAQQGDPNSQVGGCISLQNLVPDRHTRGNYAPRPAYTTGFDASTAPGLTITAPGKVTFATAPLAAAILTWTDDNTPAIQSLGTGDGVTVQFAFLKGGNPYQPVNPKVYMNDWQGNQLQYLSARTNLAIHNTETTGFIPTGGFNTLTIGADAAAGPDGGAAVFGKEGSTFQAWQMETVSPTGSVSIGDTFTFVVDFHLTPGYLNNENQLTLNFISIIAAGATCSIDILANSVLSSDPAVSAVFVGVLPNGYSRFSFVVGPADATAAGLPQIVVKLNKGTAFTGDNSTKLYVRPDMKKTTTISSWIKNTTGSAISVTDYALTNTSVGTTIGNISATYTLGSRVYGMALGNNAGTYFDFPFCYDFSTGAFVTISGITTANVPASTGYPNGNSAGGSPAAAWVAPQMELVGSKIVVTHYGFASTTGKIGIIDISTPSAPAWSATNLSGAGALTFTTPPVAVKQFNGRAYYAVGGTVSSNNVIFSDSLAATVCTNATQVLTIGDNQPVLGFGGQPYASSTVGGIIQSILAFKATQIAQITGDPTTSNLAVNVINTGTGCQAPQTICSTPLGCMFMGPDGVRFVDEYGKVQNPLPSVRNPFANCNLIPATCYPSTAVAAYNSNMYRISLYTTDLIGNVYRQEYVFDLEYMWHGPHLYDGAVNGIALIAPYGSSFIIVTRGSVPGTSTKNSTLATLSSLDPGPADSFIESSAVIAWNLQSTGMEDDHTMLVKTLENCTIEYNPGNVAGVINITADPTSVGVNPNVNQPSSQVCALSYTPAGSLWGTAVWGAFTWGGGSLTSMDETTVTFPDNVSYKNLQWQVTGTAALNQRLGPINYRGTTTGQTNQDVP